MGLPWALPMKALIKKWMRGLTMVGYAWVAIVGSYIVLQYIRVLLTDGLPFGQRVLSILNLWNLVFIAMALMPGILCILISNRFSKTGIQGNDD